MFLYDYHLHTLRSPDASDTLGDMVNSAIAKGFDEICVTDHCDEGTCVTPEGAERFDFSYHEGESIKDFEALPENLHRKTSILFGVELGEPCQNLKRAESLLKNNRFDFVIGSLHNLNNMPDFWFLDYNKWDIDLLFRRYLDELEEHVKWNGFDILGHITYPLRYIIGEYNIPFDISKYYNDIHDILKIIVKNNKGIEVNTSGLRQKIKKTLPDKDIIKLYKDAGGELITLGSDAHTVKDLGEGIREGMELLYSCGFKNVTRYKNRQPYFEKIDY